MLGGKDVLQKFWSRYHLYGWTPCCTSSELGKVTNKLLNRCQSLSKMSALRVHSHRLHYIRCARLRGGNVVNWVLDVIYLGFSMHWVATPAVPRRWEPGASLHAVMWRPFSFFLSLSHTHFYSFFFMIHQPLLPSLAHTQVQGKAMCLQGADPYTRSILYVIESFLGANYRVNKKQIGLCLFCHKSGSPARDGQGLTRCSWGQLPP